MEPRKVGGPIGKNPKNSGIPTFIPFISFPNLRHVLRLLLIQRGTPVFVFAPGIAHPATNVTALVLGCRSPGQRQHSPQSSRSTATLPKLNRRSEQWATLNMATWSCSKAVEINLDNALSNKLESSEDNELGKTVFQS